MTTKLFSVCKANQANVAVRLFYKRIEQIVQLYVNKMYNFVFKNTVAKFQNFNISFLYLFLFSR